jgi:glutamine synthetase
MATSATETELNTHAAPPRPVALPTLDEVYADVSRNEKILQIEKDLLAQGVQHIYLQFVTIQGRVVAKVIPTTYWVEAASKGMSWSYLVASGHQVNMRGEPIGPGGAATTEGLLLPDVDTMAVLPWDRRVARVFCTAYRRLDEEVAPGVVVEDDARAALKLALLRLKADLGITAMSGCEPEMSWFRGRDAIDTSASYFPPHIGTSYHVRHLDDVREILIKVSEYCEQLGFTMIQADYEDPGQLEINFQYDDFLATADRLVTYRQVCMQVAKELGVIATFMPKPVAGIMANGCHHHVSFWRDGTNVMVDPTATTRDNFNTTGKHAIGGILKHARGMMALLAPTVNSYKRFLDANWCPTTATWGYDNRACALRVVPGRIEVRPPDASCNPYLTHLAILEAVRDGWRNEIDPGAPQASGDPIETEGFAPLPFTLTEALDALEQDEVISNALPPQLLKYFLECKRDEWLRFCGAITEWDFDNYLNYVP